MNETQSRLYLNPSIEALTDGHALNLFVDDRCFSLEGADARELYLRLKILFAADQSMADLDREAPDLKHLLPQLIASGILKHRTTTFPIRLIGASMLHDALLRRHAGLASPSPVAIAIPDTSGLGSQRAALALLSPGETLLTGITRGTSLFLLPPITDPNTDLLAILERILATEPGRGNYLLLKELRDDQAPTALKSNLSPALCEWIAADIAHAITTQSQRIDIARIYRGTEGRREDVDISLRQYRPRQHASMTEVDAELSRAFVGPANIVPRITAIPIRSLSEPLFIAEAVSARPASPAPLKDEHLRHWGVSDTLSGARIAAIMEAVERFSITSFQDADYPLRRADELSYPVYDYEKILCHQDPLPRIPSTEARQWCGVVSAFSGRHFMLPLDLVRYPYNPPGRPPLDRANSSGAAAHSSRAAAIVAACHELAERDAFMLVWMRKASPPRIVPATLPERARRLVQNFIDNGDRVFIANLTTDLAPVAGVLIIRDGAAMPIGIGCSSKPSLEEAVIKATCEAQMALLHSGPIPAAEEVLASISTPTDHLHLYASRKYDHLLMRLFNGPTEAFSEPKHLRAEIAARIDAAGLDLLVADLTHPRIQAIAPDIAVVRVFIPTLIPIYFGSSWCRPGSPRLMRVPERAGWMTAAASPAQIERFPHPFN